MTDDILGGEGHLFEADGYKIYLGDKAWQMCQENPDLAVALYMVVKDTRGFEGYDNSVAALALAKLVNMTTSELRGVSTLKDVLEPPEFADKEEKR